MPAPEVLVNARAPAHAAPMVMPAAESSSSACKKTYLFLPSSVLRNFLQKRMKPSISEVDGVMGYQAATVAPANTQPSAAAVLPSMMMRPSLLPGIGFTRIGSGQSKCSFA